MSRLRIAIDMDDVLADTLTKHLAIYNLEHGDSLTKRDLEEKKIYEAVRAERCEHIQRSTQPLREALSAAE